MRAGVVAWVLERVLWVVWLRQVVLCRALVLAGAGERVRVEVQDLEPAGSRVAVPVRAAVVQLPQAWVRVLRRVLALVRAQAQAQVLERERERAQVLERERAQGQAPVRIPPQAAKVLSVWRREWVPAPVRAWDSRPEFARHRMPAVRCFQGLPTANVRHSGQAASRLRGRTCRRVPNHASVLGWVGAACGLRHSILLA
jgi:hypothetical protein